MGKKKKKKTNVTINNKVSVKSELKKALAILNGNGITQAVKILEKLNIIEANNSEVSHYLGIAYLKLDNILGLDFLKKSVELNKDNLNFIINYAIALQKYGFNEESIAYYKIFLKNNPDSEIYNNLGNAYYSLGKFNEAINVYSLAIENNNNNYKAMNNLGNTYKSKGEFDKSVLFFKNAIKINPQYYIAYNNLGNLYYETGKIKLSIEYFEKALKINPNYASAYNNLGNAYIKSFEIQKGIEYYKKSLLLNPQQPQVFSNMLLSMHYDKSFGLDEIFFQHKAWSDFFENNYSGQNFVNKKKEKCIKKKSDKIRIGYVSPDFCRHSVSYFFIPLLKNHNLSEFEIFCFADSYKTDDFTDIIKNNSNWKNITGLSNFKVAEIVKRCEIDILIDLAGHTNNNRLRLFSLRPAPVQVSWLGYPDTTGLSNIDYRFVDEWSDPVGISEKYATEKLIRLEDGFHCYFPPNDNIVPEFEENRPNFTYGSFNNASKINEEVIKCWSKILHETKNSKLCLKSSQYSSDYVCEKLISLFKINNINETRIEFFPYCKTYEEHLKLYNKIDIALDTFPYNGTTTTFESLWMGVPVITLYGYNHACRVGGSILNRVGLSKLVNSKIDDYVKNAVSFYNNPKLIDLKKKLRAKLEKSPFFDYKRFAIKIEFEYKKMVEISQNK